MARRIRALAILFLVFLCLALKDEICWLGERAFLTTTGAIGGLVLEVFLHLNRGSIVSPARHQSSLAAPCEDITFRVTKGIGQRGYDKVRISAVCKLPQSTFSPVEGICPEGHDIQTFDHCSRFQHRWTDFHLSSSVVAVDAEDAQPVVFNHTSGLVSVQVRLPEQGSGVQGIVIGDPCVSSRYLPRLCKAEWDVQTRLTQLLDTLTSGNKLDFVIILGDAFYDVHGGLTSEFWRHLSQKTQQTFLLAVPGNHDFWIFAPQATVPQDQLGFGFMQWYAQDTLGANGDEPFSTQPFHHHQSGAFPSADNFFFYHMIGNIGFLGYSAAHIWASQELYFKEACDYFIREQPKAIYLLGHWNKPGLGCEEGMDVPNLFATLRTGYCSLVAEVMYYFMGHDHCNIPSADGRGFMVGAGGSAHDYCGDWGFAYVSTKGSNSHQVVKFTVATDEEDYFTDLHSCASNQRSLDSCASQYGDVWLNKTFG